MSTHAEPATKDIDPDTIRSVIATDCGSTTTKAILIEKNAKGEYRLTCRGEAPTTVEAPVEDVTRGVVNAIREIQELRGRKFLRDDADGPYRTRRPATTTRSSSSPRPATTAPTSTSRPRRRAAASR